MKIVFVFTWLLFLILFLAPAALASNTWYVNGVNGTDGNNVLWAANACRTIGHVISLAVSGDSINIAPAVNRENHLTINSNLKLRGSNARTIPSRGAR